MRARDEIKSGELIELLNRCWMTHDGMWFFHCLQALGIEKTNQLNKAAIKGLAPFEIDRMKKTFGFGGDRPESFDDFKDFFSRAGDVFIPPFMKATMTFPRENVMRWEFEPGSCFAFKGIQRFGAIDRYECGVIYRIRCWLDCMGIAYSMTPDVDRCLMRKDGRCAGDIELRF
jgi:hypothetical protein